MMSKSSLHPIVNMKYLTQNYEGKFHFSLNEISYEEKTKLYFSELKVSLL